MAVNRSLRGDTTLVIGSTDDCVVIGAASEEIAARVLMSSLYLYEGLGYGLYEGAPDFLARVANFCQ